MFIVVVISLSTQSGNFWLHSRMLFKNSCIRPSFLHVLSVQINLPLVACTMPSSYHLLSVSIEFFQRHTLYRVKWMTVSGKF